MFSSQDYSGSRRELGLISPSLPPSQCVWGVGGGGGGVRCVGPCSVCVMYYTSERCIVVCVSSM